MSKYRIAVSEEDLLKYGRSTDAKQQLLDKLKEVEDRYAAGLPELDGIPESLGLEKLEFSPASEEELAKRAEDKLAEDFQKRLRELEKEYAAKREGYEKERESAKIAGETLAGELEENYAGAKQNLEDNALKRGLARSSVVMNQLEGLEHAAAEGKSAIARETSETVSELGKRIDSLSGELERAVADQNSEYARELNSEISALKAEQDKRREEVAKYNNTIAEKESKYAFERELKAADLVADRLSAGTEETQKRKNYEKAKVIRDFLDGMSKEAAFAFLTGDEEVKKAAGDYYSYLYNYVKLRKDE